MDLPNSVFLASQVYTSPFISSVKSNASSTNERKPPCNPGLVPFLVPGTGIPFFHHDISAAGLLLLDSQIIRPSWPAWKSCGSRLIFTLSGGTAEKGQSSLISLAPRRRFDDSRIKERDHDVVRCFYIWCFSLGDSLSFSASLLFSRATAIWRELG